jgi:dTDP-4-dehydrorhamnose 3,5-epimerase-like enzyme
MQIPKELAAYFNEVNFENYPLVEIPQKYIDTRGQILNIADGQLGDVALITSTTDAIRANHYHQEDWHLCFLLSGQLRYEWKDFDEKDANYIEVSESQMIFTPKKVAHKLTFLTPSTFIAVSKLSRKQNDYERDTIKLPFEYFSK